MKKFFALVLSLLLVLTMANVPVEVDAAGIIDDDPAELKEITLSKYKVTQGETIEVIVDAEDKISGVESILILFRHSDSDRYIEVYCRPGYWDYSNGSEYIEYSDGKLHGEMKISQYEQGTYNIERVELRDKANNFISLYNNNNSYGPQLPENFKNLLLEIVNYTVTDTDPPSLINIELEKEEIDAGNNLKIKVDAKDEDSGVESVFILFRNSDTDRYIEVYCRPGYWDYSNGSKYVEYSDGRLHGEMNISQYEHGTYTIERVELRDNARNHISIYNNDGSYGSQLPEKFRGIKVQINNNESIDNTPPSLSEIILKRDKVEVPAVLDVIIDAKDEVSGVESVFILFRNSDTNRYIEVYCRPGYWDYSNGSKYVEYSDGKLHGEIYISQYQHGTYTIERVELRDNARNHITLHNNDGSYGSQLPEKFKKISFFAENDGTGVVATTGTSSTNIVSAIESAGDDSTIAVDYTSNSTLKSDVFDAIKDTDKTIRLVKDGAQWEFSGKDIDNASKDIDLSINMSYKRNNYNTGYAELDSLTEGANAVVLKFAENGVLPGKAKISLKADYALRQYLGQEIYLYYYDTTKKELVQITDGAIKITDDNYIEFFIDHCSQYIITNKKVKTKLAGDNQGNTNPGNNNNNSNTNTNNNNFNSNSSSNSSNGNNANGGSAEKSGPLTRNPITTQNGGENTTNNNTNNTTVESSVPVSSYAHPNAGRALQVIRMFNPASGEHIITTDANEASTLESLHGWKREAVSGMSLNANNSPVFRLLHPATGKHIYTLDANEVKVLTEKQGWKAENVVFFAGGSKVKMYRLFNPKLPAAVSHHYTSDENEYNTLQKQGWNGEGVAFTLN